MQITVLMSPLALQIEQLQWLKRTTKTAIIVAVIIMNLRPSSSAEHQQLLQTEEEEWVDAVTAGFYLYRERNSASVLRRSFCIYQREES